MAKKSPKNQMLTKQASRDYKLAKGKQSLQKQAQKQAHKQAMRSMNVQKKMHTKQQLGKTARVGAMANALDNDNQYSNVRDDALKQYNLSIANQSEGDSESKNSGNIGETNNFKDRRS